MKKQLIQGSNEWHAWRSNKICASDAPVILGVSPYKTPLQLFQEKRGEYVTVVTNSMRKGQELEDTIRNKMEEYVGVSFMPACYESDDVAFMGASLDGMSFDETMACELKLNNKEHHEMAKSGKIWEPHLIQMLHAWSTLPSKTAAFMYGSFNQGDFVALEVSLDGAKVAEIIEREQAFWDNLMQGIEPEKSERDLAFINDQNLLALCKEYIQHLEHADKAEEIRQRIILACNGKDSLFGNVLKATSSMRKGAIDYSKIPELEGLDLEAYRKKGSVTWRLTAM